MRVTEGLRLSAMVATISLFGSGAAHAQGAQVAHFKSNGGNAFHNSFDGTTSYDLNASVNTSGGTTTTFLAYDTQTCNADFSVCTGIFGSGNIPNSDFTMNGANATLNTNTATNPNFTVINFVSDADGFHVTPGVGGIVNISWRIDHLTASSSTGTSTFTGGGFTHKNTGSSSFNSAKSTGTFLGVPLPTISSSSIGMTSSMDSVIIRQ
jgi:hypothetical protein